MSKSKSKKEEIEDIDYEELELSDDTDIVLASDLKKEVKERSLINNELLRFEAQIKEIQDTLETIVLSEIEDTEDRMKSVKLKIEAMTKLPTLLSQLEDLRSKSKTKTESIKGQKSLSPLEEGRIKLG